MNVAMIAFLTLIIGYFAGIVVGTNRDWSADATVFSLITFAGAFGGLLYTARDNGLELPHRDANNEHRINLGWVVDCGYGIAGSYVVFLLLPTEFTAIGAASKSLLASGAIIGLVKLLAMALVGGYGGRSLVDRALANIAKDVEEAKKSAEESKNKLTQIETIDTKALELVNRHLDKGERAQDVQLLKDTIKAASGPARFEIFKEARAVRTEHWNKDVSFMERTIPIFEALIENNAGDQSHRNYGQLGYALKDRSDSGNTRENWDRAYQMLSKAIELRDKEGESGFLMYEFNRAICGIKLGKDSDVIERDLLSASSRGSAKTKLMKIDIIANWVKENGFDLQTSNRK